MTKVGDKLDKEEKERIDELYKEVDSGKGEFTATEIFGSDTIVKILSNKPLAYFESFQDTDFTLPLDCLLYSQVLVNVCPLCKCNSEPSLIEPYLERGLVLPILNSNLAKYKPEFVDLVIQFPYIGAQTFNFISDGAPDTALVICEHCYEKDWQWIFAKIAKSRLAKNEKKNLDELLRNNAKPAMSDTTEREYIVLEQMKEALNHGDLTSFSSLARKGILISKLKYPRVFNAVPQVNQDDLDGIGAVSKEFGWPFDEALSEIQANELTVNGLNLGYNPTKPVEEYLEIILPRRSKINRLIKELTEQSSRNKQVTRINDELWQINRDVVASKSLESLNFLTRLVTDNLNIITSLLIGALVGYSSAELFGCGIGSAIGTAGGILGKRLSRYTGARIPNMPKKTVEWMKTQLESPQEKMLSLLLSKDIKTIQVWQLRRKLGKI